MKRKSLLLMMAAALVTLIGFGSCDKKKDESFVAPQVKFYSDEGLHNEMKKLDATTFWVTVKVDEATKLDEDKTSVLFNTTKVKVKWGKGNVDHEYKAKIELMDANKKPVVLKKDDKVEVTAYGKKGSSTGRGTLTYEVPTTDKKFTTVKNGALGNLAGDNGAFVFSTGKEAPASAGKIDIANYSANKDFKYSKGMGELMTSGEFTVRFSSAVEKRNKGCGCEFVDLGAKDEKAIMDFSLEDAKKMHKNGSKEVKIAKDKCYLTKINDMYYIILFGEKSGKEKDEKISFKYFTVE
ncbi:MAG: hypothetical protein CSA07_03450 [Bacteroidia bacterium]|nr:MAG: hypothetical protein CSA07_03450 [Bacteroidia bacterium]